MPFALFCVAAISTTGSLLVAQSTTIDINATVLQPSVKRFGINLGTLTNYDSGQTLKNLVTTNPGFEGQIWNSTIRCASGTATSCTDEDQYSGWPANYWAGATYVIFYGTSAGRYGNVVSSTAAGNGQGVTLNFGDSGIAPADGDYLILHLNKPGSASFGWSPYVGGAGSVGTNTVDLPAGSQGSQTIQLTAPTANDIASITYAFDGYPGKTFVQLNGTYQLQFQAKGLTGSDQILVQVYRAGVATYLKQYVTLTNKWQTYTLNVTAAENGAAIGAAGISFGTNYAANVYLDEVSFSQTNTDPTNNTVFRDPVVDALRTLQPGIIRDWSGQLGETLNNLLTPLVDRSPSGYSPFSNAQINYGLHDFLVLCQTVGAEPWFVVPTTFTDVDTTNLMQYLGGDATTTYGAKRIALGQTTPWTQVFSKIHLEFGNEAWNSGFKGGSIEYPQPYGSQAQHIFGLIRSQPSYSASVFDLILGGQAANPGLSNGIQSNCDNNDSFDFAPYLMGAANSYSNNASLFGPTFAEPEAFASSSASTSTEGLSPGEVYQDAQAILTSSRPVPLDFYEINMGTVTGSITQSALNSFTPSLGAGLAVADAMLVGLKQFGVVNQAVFELPQYSFTRQDGLTALLWGVVVDMGVTDLKRPQYLALELANQALSSGAQMLQTVHSGADPTWNQPLVNNVQFNGAHDLQSYAFASGTSRSLIVFNFSLTTALPVTFTDVNQPTGTVQMQQMTSANPTDTNESSNVVQITSQTLNNFNSSTGLTLPPYSMTVLSWTHTAGTAPIISAVAATGLTGSSAVITWTTDQASSSVVNYGTTTSYGTAAGTLTSPPPLVTSHSVSVSGLTPSTKYDYAVTSANSNGDSSTSTNYTFMSAPQAPVISNISATATASSATITWTTDQPSTSLVNYGATTSYGSASTLNAALVTAHSVTISGLTGGTTYDFDVVSGNAEAAISGNTTTSTNATFTTVTLPAPNIGYLGSWGITSTGANISWSTDVLSTTQLAYGTSTALGTLTPLNSSMTFSHGVTLTGLQSGTTYYYQAQSTGANGVTGYSTVMSFSTTGAPVVAPAPVISGVTATVTSTSVTISYTTDQPATGFLSYGTTTAYGGAAYNSTLSTSQSFTLNNLKSGTTYDYQIIAANSAGAQTTSPNYTFTPSNSASQPPNISSVASSVSGTSVTVTWTTDQASSSLVNYGTTTSYGSASPLNTALVTSHSVTLSGLTAGTTYDFDVVSTDSAGLSSTSANSSFVIPAGAPVISGVTATVTSTSATISWTTNEAATGSLNYGTTTAYGSSSSSSTLSTSQSITVNNLTSGTTYDYQIIAANSAGTKTTSPNYTFTTSNSASQPPNISSVTSSVSGTSATITWTTDQASSSLVNYGTTTSYGSSSSLSTALVTSHSVTLNGLTAGTTYDFDVVSTDSAGLSATSANATFVVPAAGSGPAPSIGYLGSWSVTSSGASVSWSTNVLATTQLAYGTTTALGTLTPLDSTMTFNHGATLTGLLSGTTYYYQAQSTGADGVTGYSTVLSFTTSGTPVVAPAPVISGVTATVTGASVTISWTTNEAATGFLSYGTTTAYGSSSYNSTLSTSQSITLNNLTSGTTYDYQIIAANSAGAQTTSSNYTFTTSSGGSQPPNISSVTSSVSGTSVTITWTTDQASSSLVNYGTTTSYGSSSSLSTALVTSHSVTLSGLTAGTTYDFDVVSTDSAGLSATSNNSTFVVPAAGSGPAPNIGYLGSWSVTASAANVSWSTDVLATTQLAYGTTTALGTLTPLNSTMTFSHGATLTGLLSGTTYYYQAQSTGADGVTGYSTVMSFTTAGTPVVAPAPVISNVTAKVTSTSVTITWTTDQAATGFLSYGTTTAYGGAVYNSTLSTSQSITLNNLPSGTTYDYQIIAANSGGAQTTSPNYTFTTSSSVSQVNSGTTASYGSLSSRGAAPATSHSVTPSGMRAGTTDPASPRPRARDEILTSEIAEGYISRHLSQITDVLSQS